MLRLIKVLFYLIVLAAIGLIGFAYLGPMMGADFTAPQGDIRIPLELNAN
ncbi:MAG: hypothetical protein AAF386_06270 [Pseudomonadota bacterium]